MELHCTVTWGGNALQICCSREEYDALEANAGETLVEFVEDIGDEWVVIRTAEFEHAGVGEITVVLRILNWQTLEISCGDETLHMPVDDFDSKYVETYFQRLQLDQK